MRTTTIASSGRRRTVQGRSVRVEAMAKHVASWLQDEEASRPARAAHHSTIQRLVRRDPPVHPPASAVCCLLCTAELILTRSSGAAARRRARPRSHRACGTYGADPARRAEPPPGSAHIPAWAIVTLVDRRGKQGRLSRRFSVPVTAVASRAPLASHAIGSADP